MRRLPGCDGQTLAVVVVAVLLVGLVAAALPAYVRFQDRKAEKVAQKHLLAAVWSAETYRRGQAGSYVGMDAVDLIKNDPRVPTSVAVTSALRRSYCLTDSVRGEAGASRVPFGESRDSWRTPPAPDSSQARLGLYEWSYVCRRCPYKGMERVLHIFNEDHVADDVLTVLEEDQVSRFYRRR